MASNPTVTPYVVPSAPTATSAAGLNTFSTDLAALLDPELVIADSSAAQSIANTTWTQVTLAAVNDPDADLATNAVTIGWGGNYLLTASFKWAANATGRRDAVVQLVRGGVTSYIAIANALIPSAAGPTTFPNAATYTLDTQRTADFVNLQPGDVLTLWVYQSSGAALNVTAYLGLVWLDN